MKLSVQNAVFIGIILLISSCKKELKIETNPNQFGTVLGYGAELRLNEVQQTKDGNYILSGTNTSGEHGMFDGFVMKIDKNFNLIWYKDIGGLYEDFFYSMAIDEDENIMLVGESYSYGVSIDSTYGAQNSLFYMVYLKQNGDLIWEKTLQANPSIKNVKNAAAKVLYLNDNRFAIFGETANYNNTEDVYGFCIDKQQNVTWSKRYIPANNSGSEYCQNACLTDDGNIIFITRTDFLFYGNLSLTKTGITDTGFSLNKYIWKGPVLTDLLLAVNEASEYYNQIPMASCGANKVALADIIHNCILFTDENGGIAKKITFKYPVLVTNLYTQNKQLVINGLCNTNGGIFPCFLVTDFEGNIQQEVVLNLNSSLLQNLQVNKIFINSQNETTLFGSIQTEKGNRLTIIKFNKNGNVLN